MKKNPDIYTALEYDSLCEPLLKNNFFAWSIFYFYIVLDEVAW